MIFVMSSSETFMEYYMIATDETAELKRKEQKGKVKNI